MNTEAFPDIRSVRKTNLRRLEIEAGGRKYLAEKMDIAYSQITNVLAEKATRNIGNNMARKAEAAMGKSSGWLDRVEGYAFAVLDAPNAKAVSKEEKIDEVTLTTTAMSYSVEDEVPSTHVKIKDTQILFAAGAGSDFILEDDRGGGFALYRKEWLNEQGVLSENDLIRGINHGHSMANYIKDGSRILIHLKDTEIDNDPESVYALRFDNQLRVKYVQKTDDGVILRSENQDFKDEYISAAMCKEYLQIIGRVIEVTNQMQRKKKLLRRKT